MVGSFVQWCPAGVVWLVDGVTALEQRTHDGHLTTDTRLMQRCLSLLVDLAPDPLRCDAAAAGGGAGRRVGTQRLSIGRLRVRARQNLYMRR